MKTTHFLRTVKIDVALQSVSWMVNSQNPAKVTYARTALEPRIAIAVAILAALTTTEGLHQLFSFLQFEPAFRISAEVHAQLVERHCYNIQESARKKGDKELGRTASLISAIKQRGKSETILTGMEIRFHLPFLM